LTDVTNNDRKGPKHWLVLTRPSLAGSNAPRDSSYDDLCP
jgi:hypothetical protein